MRAAAVVPVVPWFIGAVLLLGAIWIGVQLWGPADSLIMDVSRGQGAGTPAAIRRTEYGYFDYLSSSSAVYIDREAAGAAPGKSERVETRSAIHWLRLMETIAGSALLIVVVMALPLWLRRLFATAPQPSGVPPNNRWRGP